MLSQARSHVVQTKELGRARLPIRDLEAELEVVKADRAWFNRA